MKDSPERSTILTRADFEIRPLSSVGRAVMADCTIHSSQLILSNRSRTLRTITIIVVALLVMNRF